MHPGAITLHNYPKALQRLTDLDGILNDVAAIDLLRTRERGVPRYNDFRELLHKPRLQRFEQLSDKPEWVEQLRSVYDNDLDSVDLMIGLFAEPLPPGFGFSDTAFRIFILMASRRLESDRFFTTDFTPRVVHADRHGLDRQHDVFERFAPSRARLAARAESRRQSVRALARHRPR